MVGFNGYNGISFEPSFIFMPDDKKRYVSTVHHLRSCGWIPTEKSTHHQPQSLPKSVQDRQTSFNVDRGKRCFVPTDQRNNSIQDVLFFGGARRTFAHFCCSDTTPTTVLEVRSPSPIKTQEEPRRACDHIRSGWEGRQRFAI